MERLIRAGYLGRYVRETICGAGAAPTVERIAANAKLPPEPRPTINYILAGPVDDQYQSKRQKMRFLQAATARAQVNTIHIPDSSRAIQPFNDPISFPPVNPSRVITLHHDALVLTLCINDFDMHRVLVDLGSATDLLQLPAFKHMNIFFDRLSSASIILSRFNWVTIVTMGDIALPVKAGPVVQHVLFSLVEDLGPYNAIVGRAQLHAMKAVSSTYHQMISYLTNVGQINLPSSQLAARQCYQLSVQEHENNENSYNPSLKIQTS